MEDKGENSHPLHNPNYHSPKDTIATLNLKWHANVVRGLVAAVGTLAR